MRRFLIAGVVATTGLLPLIGAVPSAHAMIHGCIAVGPAAITDNMNPTGPCTFTVVDGDTYTGIGPFSITCGTFSKSYGAGELSPVEDPILCPAGSSATLDATAGGVAAAGNVQ